METNYLNEKQEPINHESYKRHRRQSAWQIWLPVSVGSLLVLAVAVIIFLPITGVETGLVSSQWADASLVWLILPILFMAILVALLLIGLIILVAKILKTLPRYTNIGQFYAGLISSTVQLWTGRIAAPMIKFKSMTAKINAFFKSFSERSGR